MGRKKAAASGRCRGFLFIQSEKTQAGHAAKQRGGIAQAVGDKAGIGALAGGGELIDYGVGYGLMADQIGMHVLDEDLAEGGVGESREV